MLARFKKHQNKNKNMKFKYLKIAVVLCASNFISQIALSEVMPLSPKQIEIKIEQEIDGLFKRGVMAAAADLNDDMVMHPFAVIKKKDGSIGVFSASDSENNKKLSVSDQNTGIRRRLIELATADQIDASIQAMYATVKKDGEQARQGISFEIEHIRGVSIVRFLPVSEIKDEQGVKTGKILFELESLSTSLKPKTIFAFSKMQ